MPEEKSNANKPVHSVDDIRSRFEDADARNLGSEPDLQAYRDITAEARDRSLVRHDQGIRRIDDLQYSLRLKIFSWIAVAALMLAALGYFIYQKLPDFSEEAPQEMATWIEQQKLLKQVQQVQQWLQDGKAQSDQPPPKSVEELQAWLDQIELNPDLQKPGGQQSDGQPGFVPFQCSVQPVSCPAADVPSGEGEYRVELSRLVRNANIMLADKGECAGTVNLIGEYESLFGWRKSEAVTKARTELSVARCFMDEENTDDAQTHYRRAFCASVADPNPDQAMNALYGMARIAWLNQDSGLLNSRVDCSESLLDYHLRKGADVATLHHYVSLALMHYEFMDDSREAIRLQEKALSSVRELMSGADAENYDEHLSLMLTLQLNLMEGYITVNESEPMVRLYEEVNQNPVLEDSDRLVALGMLVMQNLIDGNNKAARENLSLIIERYQTLAEFTTLWSWDAFDRWQLETVSSRSKKLDTQIRDLRLALSAERPPNSIQKLYSVLSSLGTN